MNIAFISEHASPLAPPGSATAAVPGTLALPGDCVVPEITALPQGESSWP